MRVELESRRPLRFTTGEPVRAASAVGPFGDGLLVAQDDGTVAAWVRPDEITPVRLLPPVEGLDAFSAAAGTKHLKPDLEAACPLEDGVLLLGSGSTPARMRAVVARPGREPVAADLTALYGAVAAALGVPAGELNLEGACRVGDRLRWFQRGNAHAGVASASVDLDLTSLVAVVEGRAATLDVGSARRYDLGADGLAVTDAVAVAPGVLVSAAAEDTPNAYDDGPVTGSALALLPADGAAPLVVTAPVPDKIEGLAVRAEWPGGARLIAVVDADDPEIPSTELTLRVEWDYLA
ncbi:DUF6910 family protein [Spirilliplanes yamanashiensis]|uniref:Uncharacterized protein n=1 Tax=Spirilliplanes yamanashiensis TaxID=42233 RepID=A0A8J3YDP5_9ACTN|nr:hypothetical protein [Spirilliplanes yamanashiensis]MDP9816303.1 hypothetical protein [Spirilliplanes yamanashiensis]GIJ05830.1 hypothetical protein Sya03_51820 [Spirilliplanes yamanashiensis]